MAETHDIGRLYFHGMRVPWLTPPIQLHGTSHEVEEPWRIGHCVVLRALVLPYALVIGWWGPPRTLEEVKEAEKNTFTARRGPRIEEIRESGVPMDMGPDTYGVVRVEG